MEPMWMRVQRQYTEANARQMPHFAHTITPALLAMQACYVAWCKAQEERDGAALLPNDYTMPEAAAFNAARTVYEMERARRTVTA